MASYGQSSKPTGRPERMPKVDVGRRLEQGAEPLVREDHEPHDNGEA
jgi:hypothetical protein